MVEDSYKYRNPEKDIPEDFSQRREFYYESINKPINAQLFIKEIKKELNTHLEYLNNNILKNKKVRILKKPKDI